ncbi:MAG: hypothetical protein M5R40_25235 [Anaerolineae bacterium]|nr:hypothetical protein [Anaerolineae bacterium]
MTPEDRQQLQHAYQLVKARRKAEARAALEAILTANPRLVEGYYLYAQVASDPGEAREALEIALEIDPGYARAQRALERLSARYPARAGALAGAPAIVPLDDPPNVYVSLADADRAGVEADDEDRPVSASDIALKPAKGRMDLPVKSLMAIGVGMVLLVTAVFVIVLSV